MKLALRHKYAIVFGGLISAALLLNNVVDGYFGYRDTVAKLTDIQREKAGFAAIGVDQYLSELGHQLQFASSPIKGQTPLEARIQDIQRLRLSPAFTELMLLDKQGRERFHISREDADQSNTLKDRSDQLEFKKAVSDGFYQGPTYFVNESEPHIKIALTAGPDEAGVIVASVSLEVLMQSVSGTKVGQSGYAYAVDEKGTLVAHKDLNLVLNGAKVSGLPQVRAVVTALGGSESAPQNPLGVDLQGATMLTANAPISKLGWRVFVEQPAKEALYPIFLEMLTQWLIVLVVGIALALLVTTFMVRRLVNPITALRQTAKEIASGSLNQRIDLHSGDELQELGEQFNLMAEKLSESYSTLEQKVELRTNELSHANVELQAKEHTLAALLVRAEKASKAKTEFMGMMTHELRTPLSGVIGMLDFSLKSALEPKTRERLLDAQRNAHQLLSMLGGLLDIAEMDAGVLAVRVGVFEIESFINDTTHKFKLKADEKKIDFVVNADKRLPPVVEGDQRLLATALSNLLDNAVKFTQQGSVHVVIRAESISSSHVGLRIEVVDTGIGIAAEQQNSVFEAFEQSDISTTKQFGGAGLGLAHAKKLIELMGGTIGFVSSVGLGSKFFIELKLAIVAQKPHGFKLRILAAEDVLLNQMIVQHVVERMGHTIDLVENGQLALDALAKNHYDLVLMDLRMPVMDGLEATRWIRAGSHQGVVFMDPRLPVVALTANNSEEDRKKCLDVGMTAFLTKPLDSLQLHKIISDVIERAIANQISLRPMGTVDVVDVVDVVEEQTTPDIDSDLAALDALMGIGLPEPEEAAPQPMAAPVSAQAPVPAKAPASKSDLHAKMLKAFQTDVPKRLADTEAAIAIAMGDWDSVAIIVHGIKGSAAYIWPNGAVYEISAKLEILADDRQVDEFKVLFADLQRQLGEAIA